MTSRTRSPKRSLEQWLTDYAISHQNPINKKIHWFCVPIIFASIIGISMSLSVWFTIVLTMLVCLFYLTLSFPLFIAMGMFTLLCVSAAKLLPIEFKGWAAIFVVAWIFQFIGHKVEGQKPSFLDDLKFLLIGPAWVIHTLFLKKELGSKGSDSQAAPA